MSFKIIGKYKVCLSVNKEIKYDRMDKKIFILFSLCRSSSSIRIQQKSKDTRCHRRAGVTRPDGQGVGSSPSLRGSCR